MHAVPSCPKVVDIATGIVHESHWELLPPIRDNDDIPEHPGDVICGESFFWAGAKVVLTTNTGYFRGVFVAVPSMVVTCLGCIAEGG